MVCKNSIWMQTGKEGKVVESENLCVMHLYNYIRQQGQIICFPFLSCVYMCGMQVNVGVHMCVGECAPACVFTWGWGPKRSSLFTRLTELGSLSWIQKFLACPPTSPPAVGDLLPPPSSARIIGEPPYLPSSYVGSRDPTPTLVQQVY